MDERGKPITEPSWWKSQDEIVVSSRAKLIRNVEKTKFPDLLSEEERQKIAEELCMHLEDVVSNVKCNHVNLKKEREYFTERHILSAISSQHSLDVVYSESENEVFVLNDRDHLRIMETCSGGDIEKAYYSALTRVREMEETLNFAFDENFGYLTSNLLAVGSGLRLSAIVHIPAIFMAKETESLVKILSKTPVLIKGLFGGTSSIIGNFLQISTRLSISLTEHEMLSIFREVITAVEETEKKTRLILQTNSERAFEDRILKSYAILTNARLLTLFEFLQHISLVRLGTEMGYEGLPPAKVLNRIMFLAFKNHLSAFTGSDIQSEEEEAELRADMVHNLLEKYGN